MEEGEREGREGMRAKRGNVSGKRQKPFLAESVSFHCLRERERGRERERAREREREREREKERVYECVFDCVCMSF